MDQKRSKGDSAADKIGAGVTLISLAQDKRGEALRASTQALEEVRKAAGDATKLEKEGTPSSLAAASALRGLIELVTAQVGSVHAVLTQEEEKELVKHGMCLIRGAFD